MPYIWHTTHFYIYPKKRKKHFPLNTFPWLTWTYCYLDYKVRWVAEFLGTDVKASYCFRFLVTKEVLIVCKLTSDTCQNDISVLFFPALQCFNKGLLFILSTCTIFVLMLWQMWQTLSFILNSPSSCKKGDYISFSVHQNKCFCSCFNNPF